MKRSRKFPLFVTIAALLLMIGLVLIRKQDRFSKDREIYGKASSSIPQGEVDEIQKSSSEVASVVEAEVVKSPSQPRSAAMEKIAARMSTRSDDLEVVTHADGSESMDLRGRFMHLSARVTRPDGTTVVQCFSNIDALEVAASK